MTEEKSAWINTLSGDPYLRHLFFFCHGNYRHACQIPEFLTLPNFLMYCSSSDTLKWDTFDSKEITRNPYHPVGLLSLLKHHVVYGFIIFVQVPPNLWVYYLCLTGFIIFLQMSLAYGFISFVQTSPSLWVHYLCSSITELMGSLSLFKCRQTCEFNIFIQVKLSQLDSPFMWFSCVYFLASQVYLTFLKFCNYKFAYLYKCVSAFLGVRFCSTFLKFFNNLRYYIGVR